MVANRMDHPSGGEAGKTEAAKTPAGAAATAAAETVVAAAPSAGLAAWFPLLAAIVAMPLLAYATTTFVIVPKLASAVASAPGKDAPAASPKPAAKPAAKPAGHGGKEEGAGKSKNVSLSKLLVNVSGSMGARYLLASLTLVPKDDEARDALEEKRDQLLDLASSALGSKTIVDLEKPGSRNLIRSELLSIFNNALGEGAVKEIYFTEFAVQ